MESLRLYGRYVATSIRAQLAYPGSFSLMTLGQFLVTAIEFLGISDRLNNPRFNPIEFDGIKHKPG